MNAPQNRFDQAGAWNQVAAAYQAQYAPPDDIVHYGPWSPTEQTLNLLGAVRGLRILELGCGGGQCSVAFAQQGAYVAGVDISTTQLESARQRAAAAGVAARFVVANAADLSAFDSEDWDLVFATYTLQYVEPLTACLAECWRTLHPGGRLVFALDHPMRDCFIDADEDELAIYPVRSYFDQRPVQWRFAAAGRSMQRAHYAISTWYELITNAGFQLKRLVEPQPPQAVLDRFWPNDDSLMPMRNLPHAVIFLCEKSPGQPVV